MSPSLINPALRIASEIKYVKNAGAMICITSIMTITVTAEVPPVVIVIYVIIGPTNPAVPIPEPIALFVIFKTTVEIGPRMALVMIGGSQIYGFLTILGTCNIDVPIPCANRPPIPFSRKLAVANPIICAQHPIVAAPAAIPERFKIIPSAAELIGRVNAIPINTETTIPIKNGCCSVPHRIISPICFMRSEIYGPTANPTIPPHTIVVNGVKIISSFVLPMKSLPISIPM